MRLSNAVIYIQAPTYILNTSLPASEYFAPVCADKKQDAINAFSSMLDMIPTALQPAFEDLAMSYWRNDMTEPYKSEIEFFSECSGLSLKDVITVNLIYDLVAICTSIVAVDLEGKVYHARNFDFPTVLRNDTVNLIYVDAENNTLYEMATAAGYVGVPSGEKPNGFAITMDERYALQVPWENLFDLEKGYFPDGWLIREALIKDTTFDEAVHRLSTTDIIAPIYYIVAGTDNSNNGAIITRNQTAVNGPKINGQEYNKPLYLNQTGFVGNHGWYIVETNYDYWTPAKDNRREHAIKMMDEMGQANVNFDNLFTILSTPPVLASGTVFTSLYRPSLPGYYNITIRYDTRD
jgi:hypothetical protein